MENFLASGRLWGQRKVRFKRGTLHAPHKFKRLVPLKTKFSTYVQHTNIHPNVVN